MHKAEPQMQNLEMFNTKPHSRQYTNWLEWCLHVDYWIVFWHSFCCQDVKHISRGSKQLEAMKIPASLPRQLRLFPPPNLFIHMPSNNRMTMRMMMMMMMMMGICHWFLRQIFEVRPGTGFCSTCDTQKRHPRILVESKWNIQWMCYERVKR